MKILNRRIIYYMINYNKFYCLLQENKLSFAAKH